MINPRTAVPLVLAAVAAGCARHEGDIASLTIGSLPRFETRTEYTPGTQRLSDYHVADFDGDGELDMAVISLSGEFRVLLGNGTDFVVTQEAQIGDSPIWIAGGDFDHDGDEDLVVVRGMAMAADLWFNDGSASFTKVGELPLPAIASLSVVTGDLDQDGNLDVIVSAPVAPQIRIFYGDGSGAFPSTQDLSLPGGGQPYTVQIGDVTRDGLPDLIASDNILSRVVVFPGTQGGGGFGNYACELLVPGFPVATSVGDLSGDGLPDIAVSCFLGKRFTVITDILPPIGQKSTLGGDGTDGVSVVLEQCPYDSFDVNMPDRPTISAIADVTGDGRPDLIACLAFRASVVVAPQLAGGGISDDDSTKRFYDAVEDPLRPVVADFDHNGRNDLLVLAGGGSRIHLWRSNAAGRLLGARNFDSGLPGASWMVGGDFDGDGDREVIVGSDLNTQVSVLGADDPAAATMKLEATIDIGAPVAQIEAGDLDLDGRPDLVVSTSGGLRVLRNVSTGSGYAFVTPAGTPTILGTATAPFGATIGDFDRDGNRDIAVCDSVGGGLHIFRGTNTPFVFLPEIVIPLGGKPLDVVAADFTGDRLVDLAVSREDMADIVILRNTTPTSGLAPTDPGFENFLSVPVGQSPLYLITSDFNLDGRADLVVSNGDSGSVTVLYGQATGFTGQSFPAGTGPTALLAQDLTNDGLPDILVASLVSGDFRVMVGDGKGGFPLLPVFPGTWGASNAVLQDMTKDGLPDLLISSLITERVSLVRNIRD
ncbi:MAG: VCBS repeat-containing protein [Planctomycetes bacterium]|nr:VCBS repeat-containing protein [Planctomycetota bacterium]